MPTDLYDPWPDLSITIDDGGDPPVLVNADDVRITITAPDQAVRVDDEPVPAVSTGVYDYLPDGRPYVPDQLGWWKASWRATGANAAAHVQWLYVRQSQPWYPTPQVVHSLIPMRPSFTDMSRPTVDEVFEQIDLAADSVASEATAEIPARHAGKARFVVALLAASLIESSYFPEQQLGPDDPARLLNERYTAELLGLRTLLTADGTASGGVNRAAGSIRLGGAPREPKAAC